MTNANLPPHVGDIVHYWPMLSEKPGCKAAMVTEIHVDPQLASLMVAHPTAVQFLHEIRHSECDYTWETFEPGTWHMPGHQ